MKKETASANIRVYPSSKKILKALAEQEQAKKHSRVTTADVIHAFVNKGKKNDK